MKIKTIAASFAALMATTVATAQTEIETSAGVDLVSSYIWRGQDLGGVSIQPALGVSYKGLSLDAWGSVALSDEAQNTKEFDLTLKYTTGGFSIGVTDYWFGGTDYGHYSSKSTSHVWEAGIGYDFGVVALNAYTNFAGADGVNKDGKRAYSTFITASAPFKLGGLEWTATISAVPFATSFYQNANGFAVTEIGLGAKKDIKISESFKIPVFCKAIVNPSTEGAYFVAGISL